MQSKFFDISTGPLGVPVPSGGIPLLDEFGSIGLQLKRVLQRRNGAYAFYSAFHLMHWGESLFSGLIGIEQWNQSDWRRPYGDLIGDYIFFAEDVFCGQFAITRSSGVVGFDPETGETVSLASDMDGFWDVLLRDSDFLTGWSLAEQWQKRHGALGRGMRLVPVVPFCLGGSFDVSNLHVLTATQAMSMRASVYSQTRDLADGSKVRLV